MPDDLRELTREATTAELLGSGRHPAPDKTPPEVTKKGVATRMTEVVDVGEKAGDQDGRDERSRSGWSLGDVTQQAYVTR